MKYSYHNLADEGVDPDDDYTDWDTPCPLCEQIGVLVVSGQDYTVYCTECEQEVTEAVHHQAVADAEASAARDAWERSEEGRKAQAEIDATFAEWCNEETAGQPFSCSLNSATCGISEGATTPQVTP